MQTRQFHTSIFLIAVLLALPALAGSAMLTARMPTTGIPWSVSAPAAVSAETGWGKMPLYFIPNQDQVDARVAYQVQGRDKTLYFTPEGVTFALYLPEEEESQSEAPTSRWIVKLDFVGANAVRPAGQDRTEAIISYFKGSPSEWRAGLPTYSQIVYRELWEGIDLAYSGTGDGLKYEFRVAPGADPSHIRLAYRGADLRLNGAGRLEVSTPYGGFQDAAPVAYQEMDGRRVPVDVHYALGDAATYSFRLGAYDPALPLVIDPVVLVYCGFIGGSEYDQGRGIAVDASGNAYIAGHTKSDQATFPEKVGPDLTYNGFNADAFVAKVNASGTALVYAGYIGGSDNDVGYRIAVDASGNAYVTGSTHSDQTTFPVKLGPDLTFNGSLTDAFVAKVNASGSALVYAGYIGGSDLDEGYDIDVDAAGNAYVTGFTDSDQTTFPVKLGPDLTFNGGYRDAFVAKVNTYGTALAYAGFIGGSNYDSGHSIAVDASGNAYVTGYTGSDQTTFPVKLGPDLTFNGGGEDAFVVKVKANGSSLSYAGYIGGASDDYGEGIAVDALGRAYVTGYTHSDQDSFPVKIGPDLTFNGGFDVFVARVFADGTELVSAGYIGGSNNDYTSDIALDAIFNAYVFGYTYSNEATFPVKIGPDLTYNGNQDAFVAKVSRSGRGLLYAGYIGGDNYDYGEGIAVDAAQNAYVVGYTYSNQTTFPVKLGPDLTFNGGDQDAFLAKVSLIYFMYLPLIRK
jgi:hypothetical protein